MAKQTAETGSVMRRLCKRIFSIMAPPFLLWRSYTEYAPETFSWWFAVFSSVMLSFKVACEIQAEPEQCIDIEHPAHKYATRCVDGFMYLDF